MAKKKTEAAGSVEDRLAQLEAELAVTKAVCRDLMLVLEAHSGQDAPDPEATVAHLRLRQACAVSKGGCCCTCPWTGKMHEAKGQEDDNGVRAVSAAQRKAYGKRQAGFQAQLENLGGRAATATAEEED